MDAKTTPIDGRVESSFSKKKVHQFSRFLNALVEAQEYAIDLQCSSWEFAISLADARAMDLQINDLRWMIRKGWIHHVCHSAVTSDRRHIAGQEECLLIAPDSQFVIGQCGIDALRAFSANDGLTAADNEFTYVPTTIKPFWDAERHELSVVGRVVKRYRWPATNQEMILMAFEEEAWPPRIDDPLPRVNNLEPKRRLSDTIKCLNRNQRENLVRFRGDGTGEGILWDVRRDEPSLTGMMGGLLSVNESRKTGFPTRLKISR